MSSIAAPRPRTGTIGYARGRLGEVYWWSNLTWARALGPGMGDAPPLVVRLIQAFERIGLRVYPTLFAYQFLCELVPPVRSEVVTVVGGPDIGLAGSTELTPGSFGAGGGLPARNGAAPTVPLDADHADDHQRKNGDGGPEVKVRRPKAKDNV